MSSRQIGALLHGHPPHWPQESVPPVGYLSRKALPIKKNDAEPLTRKDVQYDMLEHIFTDKHAVFTSLVPGKTEKVTFCDLYVSALYNSSKCSKVLKEKMTDTPAFGIELAKLSLLTNVGRINTTMAFFPEMKTALRTYHPVPSLQKTDGNAQDAPRIKNCLKAALLPLEAKGVPPSSPEEILEKSRAGLRPPTSVVNLIFVLANHAAPLSDSHFEGGFNFLDLFLPGRGLASDDRGRCFLWLMFHYLEHHETDNPFHDEYSRTCPHKAPRIRALTAEGAAKEDVDTAEEIEWGRKMSAQRNGFLQRLVASLEREKRDKGQPPSQPDVGPSLMKIQSGSKQPVTGIDNLSSQHPILTRPEHAIPSNEKGILNYMPEAEPRDHRREQVTMVSRERRSELECAAQHESYRDRMGRHRPQQQQHPQPQQFNAYPRQGQRSLNAPGERSMVEQAWHSILTTDPLADSDDEFHDEHARRDYIRRREILRRYTGLDQVADPE